MCRVVDLQQSVLAKNDELAAALRADLKRSGVTAVNLLSSPGSGKTALLELVLAHACSLGVPVAAITADLATENDARRLARSGAAVKQVLTGGLCHLEAALMRDHIEGWLPEGTQVLFVENVGNLVCPAAYDLGETLRVALMSVTEGEDKPVKYPAAFGLANLVVLTKTDLAEPAGFDRDVFADNVGRVNPGVRILPTSARTGHGVADLWAQVHAACEGAPVHRPPMAGPHTVAGHEHQHHHGHDHDHAHPRAEQADSAPLPAVR